MTSAPKKQQNSPQAPPDKPVTDEAILKVSKEVVVKFIEIGRLSPQNFGETFKEIHKSVTEAVRNK